MKKPALALTLIQVLVFSIVSGTELVGQTKAEITSTPEHAIAVPAGSAGIAIISPSNNTIFNSGEVEIEIDFGPYLGYFGTWGARYFIDGWSFTVLEENSHWVNQPSLVVKRSWTFSEGSHSIVAEFFELGRSFQTVSSSFWIDTPDVIGISILSPEKLDNYASDVPLVFTLDQPVTKMKYCLDNGENLTISGNTTLKGLSEGLHFIMVYAEDTKTGVAGLAGIRVFRVHDPRLDPPIIKVILSESYLRTIDLQLIFTINEPVSKIEYSLDRQANVFVDGNFTLSGLTEGVHNVIIYAVDLDGVSGESEPVYFTVDPYPVWLFVGIAGLAILGLVLFIYLEKRKY